MKKKYIKPEETVIKMKMHQQLLSGSENPEGTSIHHNYNASSEEETY